MTIRTICLGLLLATAGSTVTGAEPPAPEDLRERIEVPAEARNLVLAEMRLMLSAISDINAALAAGDASAAAEAARSAGTAAAVDVAPGVRELLPQAFMQLGMATHQHFDALADQLEQDVAAPAAFGELATLTQKCVACHETYRLDVAR